MHLGVLSFKLQHSYTGILAYVVTASFKTQPFKKKKRRAPKPKKGSCLEIHPQELALWPGVPLAFSWMDLEFLRHVLYAFCSYQWTVSYS